MLLQDFARLKEEDKTILVKTDGDFLVLRITESFMYTLYYYQNFFVEIKYDVKYNRLQQVDAFLTANRLDRYIEKLSLEEMM